MVIEYCNLKFIWKLIRACGILSVLKTNFYKQCHQISVLIKNCLILSNQKELLEEFDKSLKEDKKNHTVVAETILKDIRPR